jgi:ketosteroid isomerase-like protein
MQRQPAPESRAIGASHTSQLPVHPPTGPAPLAAARFALRGPSRSVTAPVTRSSATDERESNRHAAPPQRSGVNCGALERLLAIFVRRGQDRCEVTTPTDTTAAVDEMEVAAALQSFVALLEDDDPRKRADIYTEDATFVMPGTPLIQGRAEMLRQLENGTLLRSVTLTPSAIEARDDLAYAYGLFTCIQNDSPVTLRFLMVLRKQTDGAWRIAREFLAADSPSS